MLNNNLSKPTQNQKLQYHQFKKPEPVIAHRPQQQKLEYDLVRHHVEHPKPNSIPNNKIINKTFNSTVSSAISNNINHVNHTNNKSQENNASNRIPNTDYLKLTPVEIMNRKKLFASFSFYLDNLDSKVEQKIERGIKLLGAKREAFFSNKCTHLITNKSIPSQPNMLQRDYMQKINAQPENNETQTKTLNEVPNTPRDTLIENALQWKIVLWSEEVMLKTLEFFVRVNLGRKEVRDKRALGKALQEEKLYGPSTGAQHAIQARKPVFVPFTGHYLIVEDSQQIYRPPVCKQFTKEIFNDENRPAEYPWPCMKPTYKHRSPFGRRIRTKDDMNANDQNKQLDNQPQHTHQLSNQILQEQQLHNPIHQNNESHNQIPQVSQQLKEQAPYPTEQPNKLAIVNMCEQAQAKSNIEHTDNETERLMIVGRDIQPFGTTTTITTTNVPTTTTTTATTTTAAAAAAGIALGVKEESKDVSVVKKLGKRMFETVAQQQEQQEQQHPQKKQKMEDKNDAHFCENCNVMFHDQEKHEREEMHQAFVKDQHNFNQLDSVLESVRRVYREPLPPHLRNFVDPNVDGNNVKFHPPTRPKASILKIEFVS
ncbi:uncharacterized protein BX663DRAFT_565369 [Cokeromyces recurvatus]|uniref:uncharacterized protein n=1 Tax=Cokeromyces recurvatus TaxID=90255 RepID=UPI00221F932F|nr:uncharacterized protein BX663DRAFT_565369 [Cokeromyces recurvatus]KAI7897607.1 hypothetical protein BX663DRAFT_565369 [Cokeromyces recurvatus]